MKGSSIGMGLAGGLEGLFEGLKFWYGTKQHDEDRAEETSRAKSKLDAERMIAELKAKADEIVAQKGLEGRQVTAGATIESAKTRAAAARHAADQGAGARRYAADKGLEGRRLGAEASTRNAGIAAGASKYGADKRFEADRIAAAIRYALGKAANKTATQNNLMDYGASIQNNRGATTFGGAQAPFTAQDDPFLKSLGAVDFGADDADLSGGEFDVDALVGDLLGGDDVSPEDMLAGPGQEQADMMAAQQGVLEMMKLQQQGKFAEAEAKRLELTKKYAKYFTPSR